MIRRLLCRLPFVSAFALLSLGANPIPTPAQDQAQSQPQAADSGTSARASLVRLPGNVHPLAQPRYDRGAAPEEMPAARMMLLLRRSPQQEAALQTFLQSVQDAHSPNYRKFLTPEQFGRQYGPSNADLNTVETWLTQQGFAVAKVNKGRTAIEFSGTVGQLQQAFHTSIHHFVIDGANHWANTSDPSIPANLAPLVAGVASLNDFKPEPQFVTRQQAKGNPAPNSPAPDLTIVANSLGYLFVGPGDAATIYDSPNVQNANLKSGQAQYDGTGITIGIVGDTFMGDGGPGDFRSFFGLPATTTLTEIFDGNEGNLNSQDDQTEAILDVEVSGGLAPNATQIYYAAGDTVFQPGLFLAIYRAIDDNKVAILSASYGECEASLGAAGNLQILDAWEQAAAQGIAVTVSSGDAGSAGCDNFDTETVATHGLAVNGLASTPYNIAVGGTDFDVVATSAIANYVITVDPLTTTTALGYIPEDTWNDSTDVNGLLAANSVSTFAADELNIIASGGGLSSLGDGGIAGYAKPEWQQGFSPSNTDTVRDVPDVALFAGNGFYQALWAVCISAESECADGSLDSIGGIGGTSPAAPAFAGILAMINQKVGASTRLGQANWILYKLAQTNPGAFHQIVTGNNSVSCTSGSPGCGTNKFMTGYNAGSSYNLVTGLGSVDITNLVNDWGNDTLTPTTSTLSLSQTTFTHGASVNIGIGVNPSAATGNAAVVTNYTSQAQATTSVQSTLIPLTGGSGSTSYSELPGGTYNVYANYGGDGNYEGSISQPVKVTVSPEDSVLQLSVDILNSSSQPVSVAGGTVPLGTPVSFKVQAVGSSQLGNASPVTNATGTIGLILDSNSGAGSPWGSIPLNAMGSATASLPSPNAGPYSVSASYSGDLSYGSSNATPVNFTVLQAPTTISITSGVYYGLPYVDAYMAANIPASAVIEAGGSVTFTDTTSNTTLGTSNANNAANCPGITTYCIGAALQIGSTQLVPGANNIVATYSGDPNFVGSGPSAAVAVTCVATCYNALGQYIGFDIDQGTPANGIVSPGGTQTYPVFVSSETGFTGAVNLTCTVAGTNKGDQETPTCSFSPAQVVLSSSQAAQSTLTISTTAQTTSEFRNDRNRPWSVAEGTALAMLILLGIPTRRFRQRYLLAMLALGLAAAGVTACGGSGSGGGGGGGAGGTVITNPGTTPDVYTITIRAADAATGTVTAQDTVGVTVN